MPEFDQTLSLAAQHAQKGQLAQAQQLMEQALDMDDSMSARLQVANFGVGYGLVTRASQLYESVLSDDPHSVAAQAGLARVATDTGQHSKATAIYTELVKQYPDSDTLRRNALVALQYDPAVSEKERLQAALDWGQWAIRRAGGSEQPPLQPPLKPKQPQQPQQRPRPQPRSLVDASIHALPRVGFVSADFCQHTVGLFVKDILMALGQRWSVYVYHSRGLEDWVSKLIKTRCHWRSVVDMDDAALAKEASSFAYHMHDTGLASPYHAVFMRYLRQTGKNELLPEALGLTMTGRDDLLCYSELVNKLIDDPKLSSTLSENARRAVISKSWESNNARLIDFYQKAIEASVEKKSRINFR